MTTNQMKKAETTITARTMSPGFENQVCLELEGMKDRRTKVINGVVVTKWAKESFEVGTFGKKTQTFNAAVDAILAQV